jgi:hypothetical protein
MADHVQLNSGSGGDVAWADEISGVAKVQGIKNLAGGDGVAQMGATNYRYRAVAATGQDSDTVKASAGVLYGLTITNSAASARYVRLYNMATDPASTDTPWRSYAIPANGGIREQFPLGVAFTTGLAHRMTTGEADNDATAVTAGDLHIALEYV